MSLIWTDLTEMTTDIVNAALQNSSLSHGLAEFSCVTHFSVRPIQTYTSDFAGFARMKYKSWIEVQHIRTFLKQ